MIKTRASLFSLPDSAAFIVSAMILFAFFALPWFILEKDGTAVSYSGFSLLNTMPRGVPRYDVLSLFLVGFGGVLAFGAALFGLINANSRWVTPFIGAVGGVMAVFHFTTFFSQNGTFENLSAVLGVGIWVALIGAALSFLQVFLKRQGSSVLTDAFSMSPNARYSYLFIAPAVIVMLALVFYPLLNGILISFTDATQMNAARVIGSRVTPATYTFHENLLENYISILETPSYNFFQILGQTVTWTMLNIVPHILIGLGLAMLLNRPIRGRAVYRVLLILPWAVPSYISAFTWRFLFNGDFGFFNNLLNSMGIAAVPWLSDPGWAMVAVVIANTWLAIPFNMVTMLGGLQSIPPELYEAAEVDGANAGQQFWFITVPMLRPVMMTATLLGVIWTFNSFNVIFLVSEGGPFRSTEILSTWAWRLGFGQAPQYGIAAAFSVLILMILMFFSFTYIRVLNRPGETL